MGYDARLHNFFFHIIYLYSYKTFIVTCIAFVDSDVYVDFLLFFFFLFFFFSFSFFMLYTCVHHRNYFSFLFFFFQTHHPNSLFWLFLSYIFMWWLVLFILWFLWVFLSWLVWPYVKESFCLRKKLDVGFINNT